MHRKKFHRRRSSCSKRKKKRRNLRQRMRAVRIAMWIVRHSRSKNLQIFKSQRRRSSWLRMTQDNEQGSPSARASVIRKRKVTKTSCCRINMMQITSSTCSRSSEKRDPIKSHINEEGKERCLQVLLALKRKSCAPT